MECVQNKMQKYSHLEKILLILVLVLAVISFVFLICFLVNQDDGSVCYTQECIDAAHHILTTVDQTVDPCEDFYKFSCGNFLKEAIAKDLVSPYETLEEVTKNDLKQIVIEELENENHLIKSLRNQRKFYRACMNTTAIEEDKDQTFNAILKEVTGGWPLSQGYTEDVQLAKIMVKAREKGLDFDYFLGVNIRYVDNESSVYLEVGPPPVENFDTHFWKEANIQKILEMAEYWGNTTMSAAWELRKTIEFAKSLSVIVEKAHYATEYKTLEQKKTTISKLKNLFFFDPNWLQFLKNMTNLQNLEEDQVILFTATEEYFRDLYYLLRKTHPKFWVNYIVLLLILNQDQFLSSKIENICEEIRTPSRYHTRSDDCFEVSRIAFEGVAEAQYIRKVVTKEKRKHIKEIITNIKMELGNSLKTNKWMDKEAKESALKHLNNVPKLIGWADIVFNETEFEKMIGFHKLNLETDNLIKMAHQLTKFFYDAQFKRIGTNLSDYFDKFFRFPLLEANALYLKYAQVLILFAPILNSPIYSQNRPEYLNYGSLGSIIGHELTHVVSEAYENIQMYGRYFVDFWSNETHVRYEEETECINEEYDNYTGQLKGTFANAIDTLSENVADFTGLNMAYRAYQKWVDHHGAEKQLPGVKYSANQLFWIKTSTYMCEEQDSDELVSHSVDSFRVDGPIRSSPYFAEDFGCAEGTKMNPKKKCRIFL